MLCNKTRYSTKRLANEVRNRLISTGNLTKLSRVYSCGCCRAWHLTSLEKIKYKNEFIGIPNKILPILVKNDELNLHKTKKDINHENRWNLLINQ